MSMEVIARSEATSHSYKLNEGAVQQSWTKQSHIFFPIAIFLAVFAVYLYTGYPTVSPYRDSGDLIAAAGTLGIAHPPGYPLYTMLGRITCAAMPFANTGYRVNLMSIIFAALCASFVFVLVSRAWESSAAGLVSALLLSTSPAFYALARVSEMYSMSAFFTALIFLLLLMAKRRPYSLLIFLVFALSLGSHPAMALLLPGVIVFYLINRKEYGVTPSFALKLLSFFILGFVIFAYFPVRAGTDPVLQWGKTNTLEGFVRLITRADYGGLKLHPEQSKFEWTPASFTGQIILYIKSLIEQFGVTGFILGLLGIVLAFRHRILWPAFTGLVLTGPLFFVLSNLPPTEKTSLPILEPHLVMPNLIFALFAGAAVAGLKVHASLRAQRSHAAGACPPILLHYVNLMGRRGFAVANNLIGFKVISFAVVAAIVGGATLSSVYMFSSKLGVRNYRDNFLPYDRGKNIFRTMENGSILYDPDDSTTFIVSYFRVTQGARRDVKPGTFLRTRWGYEYIKRRYPEVLPSREIPTAQEFITELFAYNLPRRGIYTDIVLKIPAPYRGLPAGVLYKTASAGGDDSAQRSEVLFNEIYAYRGKYDTSFYDDFFNNRIIYYYAAGRNNLGLYYAGAGMMRHAEEHYEAALAMDPYLVEAWNNLGALYFNEKKYGKALARFEKAIALKPSDPALLYNAGLVAKNTGDREKTMDYFRRSLDAGYNPGAANEIGLLEIAAGNFDEASRVFGEIVSKYPGYSAARYNLGLALQKKGDSAGAAAAYEKYLPFSEDSRENAALRELISSLRKH